MPTGTLASRRSRMDSDKALAVSQVSRYRCCPAGAASKSTLHRATSGETADWHWAKKPDEPSLPSVCLNSTSGHHVLIEHSIMEKPALRPATVFSMYDR